MNQRIAFLLPLALLAPSAAQGTAVVPPIHASRAGNTLDREPVGC
jgi:hypothetical protein